MSQVARQDVRILNWKLQLHTWRKERNTFFRQEAQSPLTPTDRARFRGLDYYDPDPAWRVRARVTRDPDGAPRRLVPGRGIQSSAFVRHARTRLELPGETLETVALYTLPPGTEDRAGEPHMLFLPFRDATSGNETHETGRYLEVTNPLSAASAEGTTWIDFNYAYNPLCAYNDGYVCPLPPEENWLRASVRAGERTPSFRLVEPHGPRVMRPE